MLARIEDLEAAFAGDDLGTEARERAVARLTAVLERLAPGGADGALAGAATAPPRLDQVSDDELFDLIDDQLGTE